MRCKLFLQYVYEYIYIYIYAKHIGSGMVCIRASCASFGLGQAGESSGAVGSFGFVGAA